MKKMTTKETVPDNTDKVPFWISNRFGIALFLFFGTTCSLSLRVNIHMSIVCMVNHTALRNEGTISDNTTSVTTEECYLNTDDTTTQLKDGPFTWDRTIQGNVLGTFYFWPYAICQIPGSVLLTKYGARRVYGYSVLTGSLLTCLIPTLSSVSYIITIAIRSVLGILTACTFTVSQYMLGRWVPLHERSRLSALCFAGQESGVIFTYIAAGLFCRYGGVDGWSFIFYLSGACTFIWSVLWLLLASDTPEKSKRISDAEKKYILSYLQHSEDVKSDKVPSKNIPWRNIFTSLPVYAIIVANFTSDWAFYVMAIYVPTYLNDVFQFDADTNGFISSLPSIPLLLFTLLGGVLSDFIQNRYLSRTKTRKLFTTVSMVIPAGLLISLGYIDCSQPAVAITILTISMAVRGFRYAGFFENALDIAPYFAGVIFGISNTMGAVAVFLSSITVSEITTNTTREAWRTCFFITSAIEIFGAMFYMVFASSDNKISQRHMKSVKTIELIGWKKNTSSSQTEIIPKEMHI